MKTPTPGSAPTSPGRWPGTGTKISTTAFGATTSGGERLAALLARSGIGPDTTVIVYGGNRNWFALSEILGYKGVRNYDRSWTEYGSPVGVPVERGQGS